MSRPALDLRGTRCPLNYVRTRVELERMAAGDVLEVWLDEGEPADHVPRSLRMDGHAVEVLAGAAAFARIRVTRRG